MTVNFGSLDGDELGGPMSAGVTSGGDVEPGR
jgi:hypothetical protein